MQILIYKILCTYNHLHLVGSGRGPLEQPVVVLPTRFSHFSQATQHTVDNQNSCLVGDILNHKIKH